MKIHKIETGNLKLDGGAIFGVVPKVLWNERYPADENNLVNLSMRALLIEDDNRLVLIDTGIGDKQDAKFFGHYFLNGDDTLLGSIEKVGFKAEDITDVVLTHLHFDHCGGAVKYNEKHELVLTFPNANHYISKEQWDNAMNPNPIEKASFLMKNILPIQEYGKLNLVTEEKFQLTHHIELRQVHGHTVGQLIPFIDYNGKTLVYSADLMPTATNIPMAWITAYDIQPLVVFDEKQAFLSEAFENDYTLFFEHDIQVECCKLKKTEKGIRMGEVISLEEFL